MKDAAPDGVAGSTACPARAAARLDSVQMLRALAVTMVASYHALSIFPDARAAREAVPGPLYVGYAGVDLFFVISGFIIAHVTAGESDVRAFLAKRLARILPAYWAVTLLVGVASLAAPGLVPLRGDGIGRSLLQSLLLLPEPYRPLLGVGWTLQHELIFYLLVAGLIAMGARRHLAAVIATLFAAGLLVHVAAPGLLAWDYRLLSLYWFEFGLGVLACHLARRRSGGAGPLLAGGAAVVLATGWALKPLFPANLEVPVVAGGGFGLIRGLGFGSGSVLVLLGALALERRIDRHNPLAAAAIAIGDASYTIYLSHGLVLGAVAALAHRLHLGIAASDMVAAGSVLVALGGGVLLERFVDRPLHRSVRLMLGGRRRGRPSMGPLPTGRLQPDPA